MPSNAPNETYDIFKKAFPDFYDVAVRKKEIEIKSKYINTTWITKGQRKFSERKQCLHKKYLKIWSKENEKTYKTFENLLEKIKKTGGKKIIFEIKSNCLKKIPQKDLAVKSYLPPANPTLNETAFNEDEFEVALNCSKETKILVMMG